MGCGINADRTPQQRAALLAWWLAEGATLTPDQLARRLHVGPRNLARLLRALLGCAHIERDALGRVYLGSRAVMYATTARERAFVLALWLQGGAQLRGVDVQRSLGLHNRTSAYRLLNVLACVLPIAPDEAGWWQRCD